MVRIFKYLKFCFIPLCFMLTACGLMTSVSALLAPVSISSVSPHFTFRLDGDAWAENGIAYDFYGIEIFYRIFTETQAGGIINLTSSSQLAGNGFKRMFKAEDMAPDDWEKPVINIRPQIEPSAPAYSFLDFECSFNDETGRLTFTLYDDSDPHVVLATFELKRSVFFPEGHPTGPENSYKGFNEFEYTDYKDADITQAIWDKISPPGGAPPTKVWLMLYAFSYGFSLDPSHLYSLLESPLAYLGQIEVMCQEYTP